MINKKLLHAAVAVTLSCSAVTASAALPVNAVLALDPQTGHCAYDIGTYPDSCVAGAIPDSNYFAMDNDGSGAWEEGERVGFEAGSDGGFTLTGAQPTHGTDGPTDPTGIILPEPGQIDSGWDFFSAHGWHTTSSAPTIIDDGAAGNAILGMTGLIVHWNSVDISMGGSTTTTPVWPDTGEAIMTCANTCDVDDTFVLDYIAHVPDDGSTSFGNVAYTLHLTGRIALPLATNDAPVANDDTQTVDRKATGRTYISSVFDILANDTDANGISDIDRATVVTTPIGVGTAGGTIAVDDITGNVTYTPVNDFIGNDTFTYNVTDKGGPLGVGNELTSNEATVTITVQNAVPVAIDDDGSLDPTLDPSVQIDVTSNDTDSDGTINPMTVTIDPANDVTNGSTAIHATTGIVTYTPNTGFIGTDTFKYTVQDNDTSVSNLATVLITVSSGTGVLPESAYLLLNAGTGIPGEGSYFTMEVNPGKLTAVGITGFDHIQLSKTLPQLGSVAMPGIDEPWLFFGNLGVHQTTKAVTIVTDDSNGNVNLNFKGWDVSWNKIVSIPLGDGPDKGIAAMTCQVDCSIGDIYSLIYHATIPPGDPSGFGGVSYILHLDGTISDRAPSVGGGNPDAEYRVTDVEPIVAVDDSTAASPNPVMVGPGSTAINVGNTTGVNLTPEEVGIKDPLLNVKDGEQCIGGCVDFIATGVTTDFIDVTFKLNKPLPSGGVYRKLINGKWTGFVAAGTDQIGSADADASGNCQGPEGKYNTGLREGAACIFLRIYDGGPNDLDGVKNGTIVDPSGTLLAGSPNVPPSSTSSGSGCSISNTTVDLTERADWLLVAGFIVWLGLIGYRRNKAVN